VLQNELIAWFKVGGSATKSRPTTSRCNYGGFYKHGEAKLGKCVWLDLFWPMRALSVVVAKNIRSEEKLARNGDGRSGLWILHEVCSIPTDYKVLTALYSFEKQLTQISSHDHTPLAREQSQYRAKWKTKLTSKYFWICSKKYYVGRTVWK